MKPEIAARRKVHLLLQLERARKAGNLSRGIKDVYNTATHRRGTLLIIEEDFPPDCREVIEDIMEKVLRTGGDVEFMEPGTLEAYGHIVLIE